jgi:hypothetical protein
MNIGSIMTEAAARDLLGLRKTGPLQIAQVDAAFCSLFRTHQALRDSAPTREERENEAKILVLLKEAHDICRKLTTSTAGAQAATSVPVGQGTPAPTWTPSPAYQPSSPSFPRNGAFFRAASRLRDVFVHLWLAVKNLFGLLVELPGAFRELKQFVSEVMSTLKQAGIPRFAVVLVLILFLVPMINGCSKVIHSLFGWSN